MTDFDFTIGEVMGDMESLLRELPYTTKIERVLILLVSELRWIREQQDFDRQDKWNAEGVKNGN